jgi:hypothetical protein
MSRPDAVLATLALVVEEDAVVDLAAAILSPGRSMTEAALYSTADIGITSGKR